MSRRDLVLLFVLGLCVQAGVASFQHTPGYMDAAYYTASGQQLVNGQGLTEPFLWNYLAELGSLPVPAHAYWQPLAAWVAAGGMALGGALDFSLARLGFILVAVCIPPLTAALAQRLAGPRSAGWLAGCLALFPGFYLPYLPTTDTFGIFMLLGGLFCWVLLAPGAPGWRQALALGCLAGGLHLARADGILWLFVALGVLVLRARQSARRWSGLASLVVVCTAGYLLVMGPWMARNWQVFHTLLSPGGLRALWLTEYNDLFLYPGTLLTFERFWGQGLVDMTLDRLWAAGQNLQTLLAIQGQLFLLPLIAWGGIRLWQVPALRAGAAAWLLTFLAMTVAFPFPGARGGFFHSGAAVQPLLWALVPVGLQRFVEWGARQRGWKARQAKLFFSAGLCLLALVLSIYLIRSRVIGGNPQDAAWDAPLARYARLEAALAAAGAQPGAAVLVNDPPQYYLASRRPALSIPYGDLQMVLAAARHYHVRYLLLEIAQLLGAEDLYTTPGDRPGLRYLGSFEDTRMYQILESP